MKLASLQTPYGCRLAALVGDRLVDLTAAYGAYLAAFQGLDVISAYAMAEKVIPPSMLSFLESGGEAMEAARRALEFVEQAARQRNPALAGITHELKTARFMAPIPCPSKIWAMRGNYTEHSREWAERQGRAMPEPKAVGFFKANSAVTGPFDPIVIPRIASEVEHEMELAVVIGKRARRVSEGEAYDYVAGYTLLNDVSARDISRMDDRWVDRSKGFDTFAPMGPYLVTRDEVPDPHNLNIELKVNGEVRQSANTGEMTFKIPYLISWITQSMALEPGDVISTGTCSGVGPIKPGDTLEIISAVLGTMQNPVVAEN